jgi:hypothetical protein
MKMKQYAKDQIASNLHQAEAPAPVVEVIRNLAISVKPSAR